MGFTPQQFEQMQKRLGEGRRAPGRVLDPAVSAQPAVHEIILGLDPSLRGTGYGVIQWSQRRGKLLIQGTIRSPATWNRTRCLLHIHQTMRRLLQEQRPTVCVVESLFYAQNYQTALILGEARGAVLVAAAEAGLDIFELAPRKVKQAIVGYGAAQKTAVAKMVQRMLELREPPPPDAADALALALTFAQETGRYNLTPQKRL